MANKKKGGKGKAGKGGQPKQQQALLCGAARLVGQVGNFRRTRHENRKDDANSARVALAIHTYVSMMPDHLCQRCGQDDSLQMAYALVDVTWFRAEVLIESCTEPEPAC